MITSNPYNLPDKILKPNQISKPITLQNKKSRDRSYDFSKQFSSKGIKIESQMKKSLNLQHITSSPNLHTPSTSSSTNRPLEPPTLPRQIEYHQTLIQSQPETQNDRRIKFLFDKFYLIHEQLTNHDSLLNKLINDKDKERNSWDSPFQVNPLSQKDTRDKDDISRNTPRNFLLNPQLPPNSSAPQPNLALKQIDILKKQISQLKQQITNVKTTISREKQHENNPMNTSKTIKFNSSLQHQTHSLERRFAEDFSRIYQTIEQLKFSNHQKFIKIESSLHKIDGNSQIVGHKVNKAQEKIDNMESSIQNHMKLVNQEINSALTKIVASINQKISKALQNNLVLVNEKLKKCVQTCKNLTTQEKKALPTLKPVNIEGKLTVNNGTVLKLSGYKAEGKTTKIKMKSSLKVFDVYGRQKSSLYSEGSPKKGEYSPSKQSTEAEEIILYDTIYHIDQDGYLMDENKIYLMDGNNNLLQLQAGRLIKIKELGLMHSV